MAYTSPRTWVAGEVVTASLMNAHVRDNLIALGGTNGLVALAGTAVSSGPYSVPAWSYHVDVDASGGAVTVTLPTAAGYSGAAIEVRKTDSSTNAVTVDGYGSQTINGAATYVIYGQYDSVTFRSDGSNVGVV